MPEVPDATEFRPVRGAWPAAALVLGAAALFFLLFVRMALPEVARLLVGAEEWRLRMVPLLLGVGGVVGCGFAAARFGLMRYQRSVAFACRMTGAVAVLALLAQSWLVALLVVVFAAGFALGWLAVTLTAGLRASVGTEGLGSAIGLGVGVAGSLGSLPLLTAAPSRVQIVIAAFAIMAVSVVSPFLTPQEPSVSPRGAYQPRGLIRWVVILLGLTALAAALVGVPRAGADGVPGWLVAVVPAVAGAVGGWWLDRDSPGAVAWLAVAAGVALVLATTFPGPGSETARLARPAGATAAAVVMVYYAARSGRASQAGLVFAGAGGFGWAIGRLFALA